MSGVVTLGAGYRRRERKARRGIPRIDIDPAEWEDERGDCGLLRCTLQINGLFMHLEAVAVRETKSGPLVASAKEDEDRLEGLDAMLEMHGQPCCVRVVAQPLDELHRQFAAGAPDDVEARHGIARRVQAALDPVPVSYTHLKLPTSDLV